MALLGVALIWALFGPYLDVDLISPYFTNIQMPLGVALVSALFGFMLALFWPYFGLISILLCGSIANLDMVCFLFDFRQGLALPLT